MNDRALLDLCRGEPCYIRLPGCGNPETVVPAHWRAIGISGAGLKAPPIMVCPACMSCHDLIDRRAVMANLTRDDVQLAHLKAIMQWQNKLVREGHIKW